ncbi:hypothetical protein M413DRAFT_138966 [Hebeloma cylindrosporum]|uniref:Glycoside hydrolase family 16 protein n=1 Tax=Hebeloma cylindrosporum TaxID=76867 RepID=A0A0C2XW02_HEBCY|nr:hypothetical protein M413DRAFT_138966 [Hebeloma cylindrosporum h7]
MDDSAVNWNVTIDDFDSLLTYEDQAVWSTPDPSATGFGTTNSPWLRGTFHETKTKGASVSLNFTGPAIYIYGSMGPTYGSYEVEIDSVQMQYSAYRESADNSSKLLFSASSLTYANHSLVLRNLGARSDVGDKGGDAFLLDYIDATIQLAPAGATVKNVTYEENDPTITYSGTWGKNTGPVFSGGGTTYTNQDGSSFTFSFDGSAIYVLGDKKNDHGIYSVVLDGQPEVFLDGTSGCGGAFGLTCEQQVPTIKFLASNLDSSRHTLKLTNHAGVNNSFFDLDSIVVAVPSVYAPRNLTTGSSPFVSPSTSGTAPPGASSASTTTNAGAGGKSAAPSSLLMMSNPLLLLTFTVLYLLRPTFRR